MKTVLTHHSITSSCLEKNFTYQILSPKEKLSSGVRLMIVHDGDDYLEIGHLREQFELDLREGLGTDVCFILLPPGSSEDRWNLYYSEGRNYQAYKRFIYHELLPELKRRFSSILQIGMMGDSLAGAVSLRIALDKPSEWTHLILQSPAFSEEDVKEVQHANLALPWEVYQSVGTKEEAFRSPITGECLYILTRNRRVHRAFTTKRLIYHEFDHDHLWECWRENLSSAIKIFY
ncbi:esterase family protein [Halobacillus locisalis]|uniref:Esterase family protein n=1 Tax=Halobacillus locisalis TaxID=220753 RepID=A0A838CVY2_9BACI|nr:alpha/beta hydrolase-fold protein [Halobacillus locisalis]MBA2175915.1 esterase family protein [Halobacillus locisalis]